VFTIAAGGKAVDDYRPTEEPFGPDEPDFEESLNEDADSAEDPKPEDDRN